MTRQQVPIVWPGNVVQRFTEDEAGQLATDWLAAFGMNRHGINSKAYMWHIFTAERYPCVRGDEAIDLYTRQSAAEYIVLSNDRKLAFSTDALPQRSSLIDYFVFPPNLAWTAAFTHEDGWLGPYFAKHSNYQSLNEANLARIKKLKAAEIARNKGWC